MGPARGAGPTFPLVLLLALSASAGRAEVTSPPADKELARAIFKELVEINTTDSSGDCTRAAEAMAARLRAAGLEAADVQVLGPDPRKGNLVARLRGTGQRRPLLLLAHLDVVEARREDWSFDPFVFREEGGYFYGRGTSDDKAMAAIFVANLIRYLREGFRPDRDLVLALTADEEGGTFNGVDWLLANHRQLLDAELALNEGGGGQIKDGRRIANTVQASEKVFQSFRLEVKNRGRPQLASRSRQRDLSPGRGAHSLLTPSIPRAPQRRDPPLLRALGGDGAGAGGLRPPCRGQDPAGPRGG